MSSHPKTNTIFGSYQNRKVVQYCCSCQHKISLADGITDAMLNKYDFRFLIKVAYDLAFHNVAKSFFPSEPPKPRGVAFLSVHGHSLIVGLENPFEKQ